MLILTESCLQCQKMESLQGDDLCWFVKQREMPYQVPSMAFLQPATYAVIQRVTPTHHHLSHGFCYSQNLSSKQIVSTSESHMTYFHVNTHQRVKATLWHADLQQSILAVDTPQWHLYCSRSHHTQCPTHCSYRSPLCLHWECYLPLVAADQLYKELCSVGKIKIIY